jgi:hypothetical protein
MGTMGMGRGSVGGARARGGLSCLSAMVVSLAGAPAWAQEEGTPGEPEPAPVEAPAVAEPEAAPEQTGPHTAGVFQFGLGFRYGALLSEGEMNPWGTGLGIDVGYTLPNAIYLGANFEYFFGESLEVLGVEANANVWQLSAEGGYDIGLGENFVIRPKIGLGIANLKLSYDGCPTGFSCASSSETEGLVAPGARFMLFTRHVSVAFDARYAVVLSDPSAKAFIFSVGVGF